MSHWSERYIGIAFAEHGRDFSGLDCWGLVHLALAEERAIAVPSYAGIVDFAEQADIASLVQGEQAKPVWHEIGGGLVRAFDVALFRRGRLASHVGLVVQPGLMLHVPFDHVKIESYRTGVWQNRLVGVYRHRELSEAAP
ncbi:NlpC/P60 family protein [Rhizobium halophytocola]|uniref:Cell wall-associated NlpC family hydrolase n=1 Tax=Rhizobium halophytocola TaxID=735519 RepID=A0ABS4E450_9HYPH|nr:NlpC/P60 family protein [Rhizobium halophytocola]MBP1852679.1 cell wall-associated NlpC family hydrolase [Rhizobium halophytocola]